MDTDTLVEDRIDTGRELLHALVEAGFNVTVACWAKTSDDEKWSLIIVSDRVEKIGAAAAYSALYGLSKSMPENWALLSAVKLVGVDNPIARDLSSIEARFPVKLGTRFRDVRLGAMAVDEGYLYPSPTANGVGSRQSFLVRYTRQTGTNVWTARTKREASYRGMKAKGAVAYSTGRWEGEKSEQQDSAVVSVLLEVDAGFDEKNPFLTPDVLSLMTDQANVLADELFTKRNPGAEIEHADAVVA